MGRIIADKKTERQALKKLRESRRTAVQAAVNRMKTQKMAIKAIQGRLKDGALTVPELAAATGASTDETLWYVAALKKYGRVVEAEKDGSYFKYALSRPPAGQSTDETAG
jgi:hypothetical protein